MAKEIRRIDVPNTNPSIWAAIDELMALEMLEGTFVETAVVLSYCDEQPTINLGPCEDGDQLDVAAAKGHGLTVTRRLAAGGGTGWADSGFPVVLYYYRKRYHKPDVTVESEINATGEANAAALRRVGLNASYRPIGDIEITLDDVAYKVAANSAGNLFLPEFWNTCTSIIWGSLSPEKLAILGQVVHQPPEKYEDKKIKTFAGRLKSLREVADLVGVKLELSDLVEASILENATVMGGGVVVPSEWRAEERRFIEQVRPFYESDVWVKRFSTRRLCRNAPPDALVGVAAYKSRKLISASLIVDTGGTIVDALITGDWYTRPHPTTTNEGPVALFSDAVRGCRVDDEAALRSRAERVFALPEFEGPMLEPDNLVQAALRAGQKLRPVAEKLVPV